MWAEGGGSGPEGAGARGGVAGGRPEDLAVGQQAQEAPGSEGSGAPEVSAEGQDAECKLSYSREISLVTAGGYREAILSPAWDAHEKKKKKNLPFRTQGLRLLREH